jgi:ribosomal-protein-alanine N-acetyltransferase
VRRLLARLGLEQATLGVKAVSAAPAGSAEGRAAVIRAGRRGDLAAIASIERRSFQNPWSEKSLAEALESDPPITVLVAAGEGNAPLGYAILRVAAGEAEVLSLAVEPGARRQGQGRALLEAALERAREAGAAAIHLEVRVTNAAALALYRRLGFVEVGRRRSYYADGTDAFLMRRTLRG